MLQMLKFELFLGGWLGASTQSLQAIGNKVFASNVGFEAQRGKMV